MDVLLMYLKRVLDWREDGVLVIISLGLFPILLIFFIVLYQHDYRAYLELLAEDGIVENIQFFFLLLTALLSLWTIRRRFNIYHWFYPALALCCIFFALEEISWGQRIFDMDTSNWFMIMNEQNEINIHNVIQKRYNILTKYTVGIVFFIYGVILPPINRYTRINKVFNRVHFIIPPLYLIPGFLMGTLLMIDIPSTFEEEIGELFFSLCLFLFTVACARMLRYDSIKKPVKIAIQ